MKKLLSLLIGMVMSTAVAAQIPQPTGFVTNPQGGAGADGGY